MKIIKPILFIVQILLLTNISFSQESSVEALADGNFFFYREDYTEAVFHFLKLNETDQTNENIQYKIGICYLNIPGSEPLAIPYFEEAIKNTTPKYKKKSVKETKAPEYTYYYLGNAYRIHNELDKALEAYNNFKNVPDFESKFNLNVLENEIKSCEKAKIIKDIPIDAKLINIGTPVNTSGADYNPVISSDESTIIFMSEQKFYNAILQSNKINGIWSDPENITPQIESDGDVVPTSLSTSGKELYLVKGIDDDRDIYVSRHDGTRWLKMEKLNQQINSDFGESHASLSSDNETLYFTSNRKGGYGEYDIYTSNRTGNGDWGPAQNLGKVINTEFNEETPFISIDNGILFFSSQGHYNMGGFDIFYSFIDENGIPGDPINIGYPVNTTSDDLFYVPIGNGIIGYTSKILHGGHGKKDIYRVEIFPNENTQLSAIKKSINMHDQVLNLDHNFNIQIIEKASQQIIGTIFYDKKTGKLTYTSKTGNFDLQFKEEK